MESLSTLFLLLFLTCSCTVISSRSVQLSVWLGRHFLHRVSIGAVHSERSIQHIAASPLALWEQLPCSYSHILAVSKAGLCLVIPLRSAKPQWSAASVISSMAQGCCWRDEGWAISILYSRTVSEGELTRKPPFSFANSFFLWHFPFSPHPCPK